MSEFISNCPKCRQQILCDTEYVGKRIACPVCLQEINMPEPSQRGTQTVASQSASAQMSPSSAAGKRNSLMPAVAVGGVILVLAVGGGIFALHKSSPAPTPRATPAAPLATTPTPTPTPAAKPASTSPGALGPCRAIWTFNQDSGSTVIDITGNGYNAKVVGDTPAWVKSSEGDAGLRLGDSNCVEVSGPVVDTTQSFTVAAWVNLDRMEAKKSQGIVSMDGNEISGFVLGFYPYTTAKGGLFEFGRPGSDAKNSPAAKTMAKRGATTNAWYQLSGVYDANAKTISLYENGVLQDTSPCTNVWQATGKTAFGRDLWDGRRAHFLEGIIRDVRVYSVALTATQIKEIAQ